MCMDVDEIKQSCTAADIGIDIDCRTLLTN